VLATATATIPPKSTNRKNAGRTVGPVFDFVHAHRQGNGVTTMWSSSAGASQVSSFTVIRTYEDPMDPYAEWTAVGNIPCTSSRSYKSTEAPVSPGFVSYRIVASMNDGSTVLSDVVTIHIVQR
jgi:hypothetical protein